MLIGARSGAVLKLFGGYHAADVPTLLLFRWHHPVCAAYDAILRIESRNRIRIAELEDDEKLRPEEWESFLAMSEGQQFRRQGRAWHKMTHDEVERLVRDRVYTIAGLLRRPRRK